MSSRSPAVGSAAGQAVKGHSPLMKDWYILEVCCLLFSPACKTCSSLSKEAPMNVWGVSISVTAHLKCSMS